MRCHAVSVLRCLVLQRTDCGRDTGCESGCDSDCDNACARAGAGPQSLWSPQQMQRATSRRSEPLQGHNRCQRHNRPFNAPWLCAAISMLTRPHTDTGSSTASRHHAPITVRGRQHAIAAPGLVVVGPPPTVTVTASPPTCRGSTGCSCSHRGCPEPMMLTPTRCSRWQCRCSPPAAALAPSLLLTLQVDPASCNSVDCRGGGSPVPGIRDCAVCAPASHQPVEQRGNGRRPPRPAVTAASLSPIQPPQHAQGQSQLRPIAADSAPGLCQALPHAA